MWVHQGQWTVPFVAAYVHGAACCAAAACVAHVSSSWSYTHDMIRHILATCECNRHQSHITNMVAGSVQKEVQHKAPNENDKGERRTNGVAQTTYSSGLHGSGSVWKK